MTLSLKYDYEHDDGTFEWAEIKFEEVLAYRFTESICANTGSEIDADKMAELDASTWLLGILDRWDYDVGWHQHEIDKGGRSRFKHYIMNFDDDGIFEVICGSYRITPSLG